MYILFNRLFFHLSFVLCPYVVYHVKITGMLYSYYNYISFPFFGRELRLLLDIFTKSVGNHALLCIFLIVIQCKIKHTKSRLYISL